jgi:hypothetical protein
METSDALDLEAGIFNSDDPRAIARSLKRSAEHSARRKAPPFRSAMSMLTFYLNRGGKNLSARRKRTIGRAKDELRRLYGRPLSARSKRKSGSRSPSRSPSQSKGKPQA